MSQEEPTPQAIFDTLTAYQRSAALDGAIKLDLFSAIGAGASSVETLARRCRASQRGIRSLCDFLVVAGFLEKTDSAYGLTAAAAKFLDRRSPHYVGGIAEFLHSPESRRAFGNVAGAVRRGGTVLKEGGFLAPDHPAWAKFARAMVPMMAPQAQALAEILSGQGVLPSRVLDIAAGHGLYGISLARRWPQCHVVFQDWPGVLEVAEENARKAGLEGRYSTLPGNAFETDLGGSYDIVLITNFLHHFDPETCVGLLRKTRAALRPGGRAVTIEALLNEDRVTPPPVGAFSLVMLVTTKSGDAYTWKELEKMFREAGYSRSEVHGLGEMPQQALLSYP